MKNFVIKCLFLSLLSFTCVYSSSFPKLPSRQDQLEVIEDEHFDVLIVGGGATGAGIALEAATRGVKALLVEKNDFCSQTSSKSTKLAHGGVRYLEKAILNLDRKQYKLVKDALKERGTLFTIAPYAVKPIEIVTPIYNLFQLPYMWIGLKIYDFIAEKAKVAPSRFISARKIKKLFPHIKTKGLVGGVAYYDGQFNDARLNMMVLLTAMKEGTLALNYMALESLEKKDDKIVGAYLKNQLTDQKYFVKCKVVINATGPFSDLIRQLDDAQVEPLICPSSGVHILLDKTYTASGLGLLIPKTQDGRLLFMLPWEGSTLLGTTDEPAVLSENLTPSQTEVDYLLSYFRDYLNTPISKSDIKAAWVGLRPLVRDPRVKDSSKLCRDHHIEVSKSGLVSIMGGKWTTFRKMAQDTVDRAILEGDIKAKESCSESFLLLGSENYTPQMANHLQEKTNLDLDICKHLVESYGSLAFEVVNVGSTDRLQKEYPYIEAEVIWAIENEYAKHIDDVLSRRIRLSSLDSKKASDSFTKVAELIQTHNQISKDLKID